MPDSPDIKFLREQTFRKIQELLRERRDLDRRIISLRQTLRGFDNYLEAEHDKLQLDPVPLEGELADLRDLGLTDAVRKIIQTSIEPITARQIRDKLVALDYRKLPKNNPMAAIHGIITRLEKNGEIANQSKEGQKPAYEWATGGVFTIHVDDLEAPERDTERFEKRDTVRFKSRHKRD